MGAAPPGSTSTGASPDGGASASSASGPKLHIDETETSVSGLSSGAFMAVQFHVAFSSIMKGAAIFAGGPFYCAQGSESNATSDCMYPSTAPNIAPFVAVTKQYAASGAIDDPSNLGAQKVFLFGGADDHTVNPVVMDSLNSYYGTFMSSGAIEYVNRRPGTSHTMPTLSYGTSCDESMSPYVGNCSYDGAGLALAHIYGALTPAATTLSGTIVTISQGQFLANASSHSIAANAYAYVPASCAAGDTCRVHVAFHGCEQNEADVGAAFYEHAGYNPWADTNHIVVLYPQTTAGGSNFEACWDWYGYDSPDYAKRTGPQMAMVKAMLDYLASGAALPSGSSAGSASGATGDAGTTAIPAFSFDAGGFGFPSATCFTDSNHDHVAFGRAHVMGSSVLADGSNDALGADSAFVFTSLKETMTGYYEKVVSCE
jgi:poly(3-hydroxybutyrate) depolymerase